VNLQPGVPEIELMGISEMLKSSCFSLRGQHDSKICFLQGFQFEDAAVERRYLRYVSRQGMSLDALRFMVVGVGIAMHTQQSRTSQCEELATQPCPVGFWVLRGVSAASQLILGLALLLAMRWRAWRQVILKHYQEMLLIFLIVDVMLLFAGTSMKEIHLRNDKRCPLNSSACPNQNYNWLMITIIASYLYFIVRVVSLTLRYAYVLCAMTMLIMLGLAFPWYSQQDEVTGQWFTVNRFEPGGVVMGYLYLLLVTLMSLRCKQTQEVLSRHMFTRTRFLQSQQSSITALLQQYIPERLKLQGEIDPTGLIMEKFPVVTILFCSFDKASIRKFMEHCDARQFFSTLAGIVVDFDLLLENPNLFKLENVGQDYLVTSSVVKRGISAKHPDSHQRRVQDAVALVHMAQEMMELRAEYKDDALAEGSFTLDFKVGLHSGSCVGAVAGVQRRFYRLFGDTINTAARMCSHSSLGTIWLSEKTNRLLENTEVQTEVHGSVLVKGKGMMDVFQVLDPMRTGIAEAHISLNVDFPAQNPEFPEQDLLPPQRALSHADLLSLEASALEEAGGRTVIDMRAISLRYPRVSQGAQSASSSLHQRQSTLASESSEPRLNRDEPDVDSEGESGGWRVPPMKSSDRASRVRTSKSTEVSLRQHFIPKKKFGDLFRHQSLSYSFTAVMSEELDEIIHGTGKFHLITGQFLNAETEASYQEHIAHRMQREHTLLLSTIIVAMLFMHTYVYFQSEYTHHSRSHLWVFVIGSVSAAVQVLTLYCILQRYARLPGSQDLFKFAYIVSLFALVPLVLVVPKRYPWMGFMLLLYLNPAYSCASMALIVSAVLILGLILLTPVLWLNGSSAHLAQLLLPALLIPSVIILLRRSFFVQSRVAWQVENELSNQRLKLAGLLYDLVPSVSACTFVLRQHQDLHRLDDRSLIFREDLLWVAPLGTYACVLSTDLVDFTPLANSLGAEGVVHLLHDLWCIMDEALQFIQESNHRSSTTNLLEDVGVSPVHSFSQPRLASEHCSQQQELRIQTNDEDVSGSSKSKIPFKIDTVGDAYMVAIMLEHTSDQIEQHCVLEMMKLARSITMKVMEYSGVGHHGTEPGSVKMRMGMCLGKAASGLVGLMKPRYHIVGDPLHLAAELESKSLSFHVLMDQYTADTIHSQHLLVDLTRPGGSPRTTN